MPTRSRRERPKRRVSRPDDRPAGRSDGPSTFSGRAGRSDSQRGRGVREVSAVGPPLVSPGGVESVVEDHPERDVVQLAAHNAFQYVGARYGVEMRPLVVNLAASGDVKPSDVTAAKRVIEENDIRYVGAAVFETRKPAKQLLAETAVEAYYPVTPYAGVREDWVEAEWGYEEIAYNVNMPTFEVVLGNTSPEEVGYEGWNDEWRNFE